MAAKQRELQFNSWEAIEVVGKPPSTRYSHSVVILDDMVYVFGGVSSGDDGPSIYHGDLFSLNMSLLPLEWECIDQKGAVPSPREGAHFVAVGDKLYLHGGIDKEGSTTCAEGLFVFTPATAVWEQLNTTGHAPTAQSSSAVLYDKKLITLGGIVKGVAQNYLHFLNLDTLEWTAVEPAGSPPPPRCDHLAFMMRDKMVVTAGSGSDELWFNDVHMLDTVSWQWTKVDLEGSVVPSPRDYASVSLIADRYAVQFGGFSGSSGEEVCFADLHYVDFSKSYFEWQCVTSLKEPLVSARYAHSSFFHKSKLYVFGGQNLEEEFNDIWSTAVQVPPVVNFDPTPVPRVRYTTSTPIPVPRKVIIPAPPATPKPRDLDEIRANYIKKINELFDTLSERFQHLDMANATLESEKAAFESEKKAHAELYEKQQTELEEMLRSHKEQNEEWIGRMRNELDEERRLLAEDKASLEAGTAELATQQETFQQKSKKLDAIMRQVQGLKD